MAAAKWQDLGHGITCIDADYFAPGIACFYLLERDGEFAVIETGTSSSLELLLQCFADKGIADQQLRYVIPTHVHLDHAGGAGTLMAHYESAQMLVHPKGAQHLIDPERLVSSSIEVYGEQSFRELYGEITPVPADRVTRMEDESVFSLGQSELEIRHTRGHADHHFCIWDVLSQSWFSGDMFGVSYASLRFDNGSFVLPATTPTQFNPDLYIESVNLLASYHPLHIYLTHYGALPYESTLTELLCAQIEAYRELGPQHRGDQEGMEDAVIQCIMDFLKPLRPPGGVEAFRGALAMDAKLNAQGLEVWAQREVARQARSIISE
ncbi:MAG: MBL fold metallo-hydrolase [Halioglobus sp.]